MRFELLRSRAADDEIPTSPMADIAFLLVIFFMLTMTFAASRGLDFALPKDRPGPVEKVEAVHVEVLAGGVLSVDQRSMRLDELLAYLAPKLAQNPDKPVLLAPQGTAEYGHVVAVYDVLRQGRERLGLERDIQIALPEKHLVSDFWF